MAEALRYPPLPPGAPHLMPFEADPFNGDTFVEAEVLRLGEKWRVGHVVETGTCYGSSTLFFADHFQFVHTIESNRRYRAIFLERAPMNGPNEVTTYLGDSVALLPDIIERCTKFSGRGLLFFLDAHAMDGKGGEEYATVLKELKVIARSFELSGKPVAGRTALLLHDFQVPDLPEAGYDSYNGQPFTLEWILPYLNRIYGEGKWTHNYPTEVAGAKRGWISIEPA